MSVRDTFIANFDKVAYTSYWDMDKIIGVGSGTIDSPAPTPGPPTTVTQLFRTAFGDRYYFEGIFSYDDGVTWNMFNAMVPDLTTPTMPVFQTVDCFAQVSELGTLNVTVQNYYDSVHGVGRAYTVLWKAVFFSKNRQGSIALMTIPNATYFTSVNRTIQKIAMKGEVGFNLVSGGSNTLTLNHGLGYVPKVRAFYSENSPSIRLAQCKFYSIDVRIDENDLTFFIDSSFSTYDCTGQIEYRVYYDS